MKTHSLDTKGLKCPEPVMMLHQVVRDAAAGDTIVVEATDPSTQRDIPKFCAYLGHEFVSEVREAEVYIYTLIKGPK